MGSKGEGEGEGAGEGGFCLLEMKIIPTPNALMTANTEGPSGDAAKRMVPRVLMKQLKEIRSAVVITISTFLSAFAFGWVTT